MKPQIIITPGGEELVVLPKADFEALVAASESLGEDDADAAVFDARMADLQAGRDQRLPVPVSAALLRGESLLKALRNWRDVTQVELSFRTGLTQGYISDLEAGHRKGTRETLSQLAEALGVDAAWLNE